MFPSQVVPESGYSLKGRKPPTFKKWKTAIPGLLAWWVVGCFFSKKITYISDSRFHKYKLSACCGTVSVKMLPELHAKQRKHIFIVEWTYFFCPLCLRGTAFCLGVLSQAPSVLSLASLLFKGWFFHGITYPGVGLNCFKSPCPNELRSPQ